MSNTISKAIANPDVAEAVSNLIDVAKVVIKRWETGNLSEAVTNLNMVIGWTESALEDEAKDFKPCVQSELLNACIQARAALPDAWSAVQCDVPKDVIEILNSAISNAEESGVEPSVPTWANYKSIDKAGNITFFEDKPVWRDPIWIPRGPVNRQLSFGKTTARNHPELYPITEVQKPINPSAKLASAERLLELAFVALKHKPSFRVFHTDTHTIADDIDKLLAELGVAM